MNADEIVRALRCCGCGRSAGSDCDNCPKNTIDYPKCAISTLDVAADLIESLTAQLIDYHHMEQLVDGKMAENQRLRKINEKLQSQLTESQREGRDARNELCNKCGRYHEAHKGTCGGCRWKE